MISVAMRADAGRSIGSGHVMRCLTLATELRRRGAEVRFICRRQPGDLTGLVGALDFEVQCLPELPDDAASHDEWSGSSEQRDADETVAALGERAVDWIVVDHYQLGERWERRLSGQASVCAIDDLANRDHHCRVLLDQNHFGPDTHSRYRDRVAGDTLQLLGPRYALLPAAYAEAPRSGPRNGTVKRVLVFFGGSDQTNETAKVLAALTGGRAASLNVDVVLGSSHPDADGIRRQARERAHTKVFESLPTLAPLMGTADLFVGSAGSTTWERAYFGIPSIVAVVAANQAVPAVTLAREGRQVTVDARAAISVEQWQASIEARLDDPAGTAQLGAGLAPLVDGLGTRRVARALLRQDGLRIAVRPANAGDEQAWFDWANDPAVRALSFHTGDIDRESHTRWFRARLSNPDCLMFIAEDETGLALGQLRLDVDAAAREAVVSISVDRCARGIGIGDRLLDLGIARLWQQRPGVSVIAEVIEGNERSERLFTRRGFQETQRRHAGARCFILQTTGT